jgi:hypothetical protein
MACNNLISILHGTCSNNSGGLFNVAKIFDMEDVITYSVDTNTHTVSQLTISSTASLLHFKRNTSSYESLGKIDLISGSTYQEVKINFVFHMREAAKSKAIKMMALGQRYLGIALGDVNGRYWYFPNSQVFDIGDGSGKVRADGSKYSLVFLCELDEIEYELPSSIWNSL